MLDATGGWPVAFNYALTRLCRNPLELLATPMPADFDGIAAAVFGRRTGSQRAFLFSAALYPTIDDELLTLAGWDEARAIRAAMSDDAPFMWEADAAGDLRFHDRFRDYLAQQFTSYDIDFRTTIAQRTVHTLSLAGRHADAQDVDARAHREIGRSVLDASANALPRGAEPAMPVRPTR